MKKRLVSLTALVFIAALAVGADKKLPSVKLVRAEGKPEEFQLNPTAVATERTATWEVSGRQPESDEPELEFTTADGKSLSLDLEFDTFDSKENVYSKFIQSLESLTLPDPALQRPPLVKVLWSANSLPTFSGVVQSMSTKYTMFMPDGTPVRATCSIKLKSASKLSYKKSDSGQ
jgi:hypothetical protein